MNPIDLGIADYRIFRTKVLLVRFRCGCVAAFEAPEPWQISAVDAICNEHWSQRAKLPQRGLLALTALRAGAVE